MESTRIVATIGPATASQDAVRELLGAGMDVARLNGSHADLEWHANTISMLRKVDPNLLILLDIPGRKIRTAALAHEPAFAAGDEIHLSTELGHDGRERVTIGNGTLRLNLSPGDLFYADDGTLRFSVIECDGINIRCRAEGAGTLRSKKGINLPHIKIEGDLVTPRDREMLRFAGEHGVDFVGISFVESAKQVELVRDAIGALSPRIVSKVENQGGLDQLDEIVQATDAVMIDRGDLAVETKLEATSIFQKRILKAAQLASKPVIVATEVLHSMIENPYPTKAEVGDITNAVIDGCAALMLSGETAIGKFPVGAIEMMRQVANEAETHVQELLGGSPNEALADVPEVMSSAIADICRVLPITKIVAVTRSGYAARTIAARRPKQPILAVSDDPVAARSFNMFPGTQGIHLDIPFSKTSTDHIAVCLHELWRQGQIDADDVILVSAVAYPRSGNRMNILQTHHVTDLAETLDW